VFTQKVPGRSSGDLLLALGGASRSLLVTAQQPSEQFSVLRADHRFELANHSIQVERAWRLWIICPISITLFRFRFLTGVVRREASPPSELLGGALSPPFLVSRACLVTRRTIVHGSRPRPGRERGPRHAQARRTRARETRGRTRTAPVGRQRAPHSPQSRAERLSPQTHTSLWVGAPAAPRRPWSVPVSRRQPTAKHLPGRHGREMNSCRTDAELAPSPGGARQLRGNIRTEG
jgi:hypothetical protein